LTFGVADTPSGENPASRAVRERRLALGLSQTELARRAAMTQPALSRLEAGGVIPTIPLLERITTALDADLIVEIAPHAA
jgi:predicted transcriptional regulator